MSDLKSSSEEDDDNDEEEEEEEENEESDRYLHETKQKNTLKQRLSSSAQLNHIKNEVRVNFAQPLRI